MRIPIRTIILLFLILAGLPDRARADCDAIGVLSVVHDRYQTILQSKGDTRARAAARLYPFLSDIDTRQVGQDLDSKHDGERVVRVLNSARSLAEFVISGVTLSLVSIAPHTQNVTWLGDVLDQSDCPSAAPPKRQNPDSAKTKPMESRTKLPWGKFKSLAEETPYAPGILLLLGLVLLAVSGLVVLRTRSFRIRQLKRLPRYPVGFSVPVSYIDANGGQHAVSAKALDISLGGMKLGLPDAPKPGTSLNLALPFGAVSGSIIWSNAHYAGILFDKHLSPEGLAEIRQP